MAAKPENAARTRVFGVEMPDMASQSPELLSIWLTLSQANSEDHLLELLCESIHRLTECDGCDLFLGVESNELVMRASTYTPELTNRCRLGPEVGLCGKVLKSGTPRIVPNGAAKHPDNVLYPGIDDSHFEAIAVLPIISFEGPIGVLLLFWHDPQTIGSDTVDLWESWVSAVSDVFAAAQKCIRIGSQLSKLDAVSQVAQKIASSPYLEEILQLLVNMTAQQFGYTVCTVRLLDDRRNELVLRATQASARAYRRKPSIKLGESIAGKALSESRVVIVRDVLVDPDYIGHDLAAEQGLRSMICVPLMMHDQPLGVMSCYTSDVRDFANEEIEALETIAQQASFAIERARIQVRSTLLQEMNHRVKNNLQQITSLLRLQMRHGSDAKLAVSLQETLSRISAIAAVHDLLSREDLDHVGLRTLAETLVHLQKESIVLPHHEIDYQVRGDDVFLATAQATQIALILNELLQNAVEHGFKSCQKGSIHITIENRGGDFGLWVSNIGDPLPSEFNLQSSTSLGLTIVASLIKNLGGTFALEDRLGWTVAEVRCHLIGAE